MGREIKRVAMDCPAEIGKTWPGYVNTYYRKCPYCDNGMTSARQRFSDLVSLLMLSGDDARRQKAHPYFYDAPLHHTSGNTPPSVDMTALTEGLAGRSPSFSGHDSCDNWTAEKKIIAAAGLSEDWGLCPSCKGDAIDPQVKSAYEAWVKTEPPTGAGYQLWETTSEGSPLTPVFATPEDLAHYCADNNVSSFGNRGESYETELEFITGTAWAPTMIIEGGIIKSGVNAIAALAKAKEG